MRFGHVAHRKRWHRRLARKSQRRLITRDPSTSGRDGIGVIEESMHRALRLAIGPPVPVAI